MPVWDWIWGCARVSFLRANPPPLTPLGKILGCQASFVCFASAALKDGRGIVLMAVKQNGRAQQCASAALNDESEIMLEAVHLRGGHGGERFNAF